MQTVYLNHSFTTLKDVQDTYDALKITQKKDLRPAVHLQARVEIEKFDILFIAYFLLFKLEYPETEISLSLPFNNQSKDSSLQFTLFQYGTYAYLMTGLNVFRVSFGGKYVSFDLSEKKQFPVNWLVLSQNFMLLLLIDKKDPALYDLLYEAPLNRLVPGGLQQLPEGCSWDISAGVLLKKLVRSMRDEAVPKDRHSVITGLGGQAFYRSLAEMKVLSIYMDGAYLQNEDHKHVELNAGPLTSYVSEGKTIFAPYLFYEQLKPLIDELSDHPLISQFIFSTIISSKRFPGRLTKTTMDNFYNLVVSSWEFTKELVYGLKELIKNVRQHTPSGQGVVTGRIYEKRQAKGMRETILGQTRPLEQYLKNLERATPSVQELLEISIVDLGQDGVIGTLLKNSEDLLKKVTDDEDLGRLIRQDISQIKEHHFEFRDLLELVTEKRLNQQTKRSVAHWGFNIFTQLVYKNQGLLLAATNSKDQEKSRDHAVVSTAKSTGYISDIQDGTLFQLIFPIVPKEDFVPHLPGRIELPEETTETDIRGLEALFGYHVLDWKSRKGAEIRKDQHNLFNMFVPTRRIDDRAEEYKLWQLIYKPVEQVIAKNPGTVIIYHINLDQVALDSSQLLRLLGQWEDHFRKVPLMVSGVPAETYEAFIRLNMDFHSRYPGMSFWNVQAGVVFYTYTHVRNDRFYFADILWGDTLDDYLVMNRLIARTNFNYTSFFMPQKPDLMARITQYPAHPAFFNKHVLLPFDILLESGQGLTLFEHNSKVLLENVIRPVSIDYYD